MARTYAARLHPDELVDSRRAGTFEQKRRDCRWMCWTGRALMAAFVAFWTVAGLYAGIQIGPRAEAAAEWAVGQIIHRPEACRAITGSECAAYFSERADQ
ncbi:hypothetical protein A6J80_17230 [Paracoccus yeei]|uniref:Uncharacterized protein n=1 Tax=Paracoccus yeei TaxID=147645 RepID=A0A1V0GVM0_9RHOB|nr:hypothetical protein [Paracoccus yeei]ARC37858.1 hypothetical protein A6J80_17230 [Paracoccus yeei]